MQKRVVVSAICVSVLTSWSCNCLSSAAHSKDDVLKNRPIRRVNTSLLKFSTQESYLEALKMKFEEDQKAQNEKIEAQNKKIEVQNKEIENLKSLVKGLSGELEGTKRKDDNKEASFVGSKDFNDLKIQFENLSKQLGNLALKVSSFIDKKEKNKDE